jgi:hypothetical protein
MSRIEECVKIMKQVRDMGFPSDYEPVKELSKRLSDYIKTGEPWSGKIKFNGYDRTAYIILPRRTDREISVVLKFEKH